ncbi:MAG: hypothetical protein AUG08_08515 [Acidobacteria bacterium 13_1_20CM_2_55_15]|nr:MAG: hypothetical protein AUG08_08515 [Acidobacteria bacterium 13_1_20CM_2_55_15]PYS19847.1 MAG: hypothetical protein DMG17_01010 [Acidobacteriota bacterium]
MLQLKFFQNTFRIYDGNSAQTRIWSGFQPRKIVPCAALERSGLPSKQQARGGKFVRAKISIAAVTVLAFVLGTMASGIYTATSRAFNPVDEKVNSPAETVKSTAQTHFVQPKTVYVSDTRAAAPVYQSHRKRSLGREALIVGGSAGAGAAIGAAASGGKGAGLEQ